MNDKFGQYGIADFPKEEYRQRIDRVQKLMAKHGMHAMLITSEENVSYFSGFRTTIGGYIKESLPNTLIVPASGSPCLVLGLSMRANAQGMSSIDDVQFLGWEGVEKLTDSKFPEEYAETIVGVVESKDLRNKTIGLELNHAMRIGSSQDDFEHVKKALPNANFVDAGPLIWELRMVKSSLELEHVKKACDITCRGFRAGFESLKAGMTEREFARIIYRSMIDAGCEDTPVKMWLNLRAGSDRYAMLDSRPTDRSFKKGDIVVLDGGLCYRGYFSNITRIACIGTPSKRQKELYDIAQHAEEIGIESLRAGVSVREVYDSVMDFIRTSGYGRYQMYDTMGHGVGLDFHEPPYVNSKSAIVLESGMLVTMEPCLYDVPVVKTILGESDSPGEGVFFVEDEIVITNSKPEILSSALERVLYVA